MLQANNLPETKLTAFPVDAKRPGAYVLTAAQLNAFVTRQGMAASPTSVPKPTPKPVVRVQATPKPTPKPVNVQTWLPTAADKGIRKGPSAGHYVITKDWLVATLGHVKGLEAQVTAQQAVILRSRVSMDQVYASVDVLAAQVKTERDKADQRAAEDGVIIAELQRKLKDAERSKTANSIIFSLVGFGLGKATN